MDGEPDDLPAPTGAAELPPPPLQNAVEVPLDLMRNRLASIEDAMAQAEQEWDARLDAMSARLAEVERSRAEAERKLRELRGLVAEG